MTSDNSPKAATLYYYAGPQLLAALKRGYLSFESDWGFLKPYIDFQQWHVDKSQPVTDAEVLQGLRAEYEKLPDNIRALLDFDDFLKQRDKFEPGIRARLESRVKSQVKGYPTDRFDNVHVLRLFSSAVNLRAWQDFGQKQTGLCIGLDVSTSAFTPVSGYPVLLKPVQYGIEHPIKPTPENPVPGAFCDDEVNASMGEWRALLPATAEKGGRLKLKQGVVTSVYFSVQADEVLKQQVSELVTRDLNFRQASLYQVVPDMHRWRLTATPVPTR
jgi:hypothetical protein